MLKAKEAAEVDAYFQSPGYLKWHAKTVAKILGTDNSKWLRHVAARKNAADAKRRSAKIKRTPPWADLDAIAAVYREAKRLTDATGIQHEVDHIIPLQGRNVSGLHVHDNLQAIPKSANRRKFNSFEDGE